MDILTATRLQKLRKENGYSQDVLAEKLGISRQAVSKWERAESSPDTDNLIALSKLYGLTLDEMLDPDFKAENSESVKTSNAESIEKRAKELAEKVKNAGLYPQTAKKMFVFPFPLIVVAAYLICGFVFDMWHPSWIIFLTIPTYYQIAAACKAKTKKGFKFVFPVPEIVVMAFLFLGCVFNFWGYGAILFILIPIYYWAVAIYAKR